MLRVLRIAFFVALVLFFLVACKHKKHEVKTALKTPAKSSATDGKKMPGGPSPSKGTESQLREQLGMSSGELHKSRLYSFVLDWYGAPYKYGGCQKSGVDCSCFTSILCEKVYGYSIPRTASDIFKACDQLSLKDAREGDLVFFTIGGRQVSHVGVFLRKKMFVHASTSKGVILNSLDEAYYKKYFFSAGRMKDA